MTSEQVGHEVLERLKSLDGVAYLRFASVYRSFQDVAEFREEIERLEKRPHPESEKHQIPLLPEEGD